MMKVGLKDLQDRTIAHIKGLKRIDPAHDIHLPGELSFIKSERAIATQELEINEHLFRAYWERTLLPRP